MISMSNEVLKPKEAAEYLRINREVLRRLSEQGRIQGAYKVGSQWRYVKAELLKRGELKPNENNMR